MLLVLLGDVLTATGSESTRPERVFFGPEGDSDWEGCRGTLLSSRFARLGL